MAKRAAWFIFVLAFLVSLQLGICIAQSPKPDRSQAGGTGNGRAKEEALSAIPFRQLAPQVARHVQAITYHPTMYRRLPAKVMQCDREMFLFMIRHPDALVGIWDVLGITRLKVQRMGEFEYRADDGAGTISQMEMLYGTPELHLFMGQGYYEGPLFGNKIHGEGVMLLRSRFLRDPRGNEVVECVMDAFLRIEPGAVDLAAKTLHPLFVRNADINFTETIDFMSTFAQTAKAKPEAVYEMIRRMRDVDAETKQGLEAVVRRSGPRIVTYSPSGPYVPVNASTDSR